MGYDGPIDINHLAIHEAIRLYDVDNPRECFEKVLVMSQKWMERVGDTNGENA